MKFPMVLLPALTDRQLQRFRDHVDSDESGWYRRFTESIWRRHQHPSNAPLSGWTHDGDKKRRLIHFYDEYAVEGGAFVLRNAYLHVNLTLPADDIAAYDAAIRRGLLQGGWSLQRAAAEPERFRRGDLVAVLRHSRVHPEDLARGNAMPSHYRNLDVIVRTADYALPTGLPRRPWDVFFEVGLREKLARGEPKLIDAAALAQHLPAQVELGCGPSIEAGIPHLSTLHRIYGVSHADYGFIYRSDADGLLLLFGDPDAKYREMTEIYRACLTAEAMPFYLQLRDLHQRGFFVGPIVTNNFDCQCADLGLPEVSLRRYDFRPYYPEIEPDPRAKSLLVIGVHADRRLVQMRARRQGLRVIFIDPERYIAPDGSAIPYPVEAPQTEDLFVRATARDAFAQLHAALGQQA